MSDIAPFDEIIRIRGKKEIGETGGAHGQKGIEFQRHWSILQMIELEEAGAKDFLFLYEAVQDVSILDSTIAPTSISTIQVKKKDRKEWSWTDLTALQRPGVTPRKPKKTDNDLRTLAADSVIGKLHSTVREFKHLRAQGCFVSNMGCDIPTSDGNNFSTSLARTLDYLPSDYRSIIHEGLSTIAPDQSHLPDLIRIRLEKTAMPVDNPRTFVTGRAFEFLDKRCPTHSGQARSLVEALLVKISPLGARTEACVTFDELRSQHGFSRSEFQQALASLESVPDYLVLLNDWITVLSNEGMSVMETTRLRVAASSIYRDRLIDVEDPEEKRLNEKVEEWIKAHPVPNKLLPYFRQAEADLHPLFNTLEKSRFQARFALKALEICVAQS